MTSFPTIPGSGTPPKRPRLYPVVAGILATLLAIGGTAWLLRERERETPNTIITYYERPVPIVDEPSAPPTIASPPLEFAPRYVESVRHKPERIVREHFTQYLGDGLALTLFDAEHEYFTVNDYRTGEVVWTVDEELVRNERGTLHITDVDHEPGSDVLVIARYIEAADYFEEATAYDLHTGEVLGVSEKLPMDSNRWNRSKTQLTTFERDYMFIGGGSAGVARWGEFDNLLFNTRAEIWELDATLFPFLYEYFYDQLYSLSTGEALAPPPNANQMLDEDHHPISDPEQYSNPWIGATNTQVIYCNNRRQHSSYNPFTEQLETWSLRNYGIDDCDPGRLHVIQEQGYVAFQVPDKNRVAYLDLEDMRVVAMANVPADTTIYKSYNKWVANRTDELSPRELHVTHVQDSTMLDDGGRTISHNPATTFVSASEDGVLYFWDATEGARRYLAYDYSSGDLLWELDIPHSYSRNSESPATYYTLGQEFYFVIE